MMSAAATRGLRRAATRSAAAARQLSHHRFVSSSTTTTARSSSLRFMLPAISTTSSSNGIASPSTTTARRFLSDDSSGSHSDFAAQRKTEVSDDKDEALNLIEDHVRDNPVMLYMKGSPSMPMCGFSAQVVAALKETDTDFASVNVLDYPSIREGVKQFSDWPTIPQLYVQGEFIGGCDIVLAMKESGELKELLQSAAAKKEE